MQNPSMIKIFTVSQDSVKWSKICFVSFILRCMTEK